MGYSLNPPKRLNCHYDESHAQRESPYLKRFDPSKFQKQVQKFRYDGRNIFASGAANSAQGTPHTLTGERALLKAAHDEALSILANIEYPQNELSILITAKHPSGFELSEPMEGGPQSVNDIHKNAFLNDPSVFGIAHLHRVTPLLSPLDLAIALRAGASISAILPNGKGELFLPTQGRGISDELDTFLMNKSGYDWMINMSNPTYSDRFKDMPSSAAQYFGEGTRWVYGR